MVVSVNRGIGIGSGLGCGCGAAANNVTVIVRTGVRRLLSPFAGCGRGLFGFGRGLFPWTGAGIC